MLWFAAGLRHGGRAPHTPCAGDRAVHAAVPTSGPGLGLSGPGSRHEAATLVEPATHPGRPAPAAGSRAGSGAPRAVAPPLTPAPPAQACMTGQAFRQCTACSPAVVGAYRARGWDFIREALEARAPPCSTPCSAVGCSDRTPSWAPTARAAGTLSARRWRRAPRHAARLVQQ